jgi:hypothetical protein
MVDRRAHPDTTTEGGTMGTSPDDAREAAGPNAAGAHAGASLDDSGLRREEDLDPDDEDADGEPAGAPEGDLDPDDDSIDPDDMNIPAAGPDT